MSRTFYDEMFDAQGVCRPHYQGFARWLAATPDEQLAQRRREADLLFHRAGITFTLYGDEQGTERLIPFDTIPRSIPASEWRIVEQGCKQRIQALNMFLDDLYHGQRIIKAGIVPAEQVLTNPSYQLAMQGLDLHRGIYAHVAGIVRQAIVVEIRAADDRGVRRDADAGGFVTSADDAKVWGDFWARSRKTGGAGCLPGHWRTIPPCIRSGAGS